MGVGVDTTPALARHVVDRCPLLDSLGMSLACHHHRIFFHATVDQELPSSRRCFYRTRQFANMLHIILSTSYALCLASDLVAAVNPPCIAIGRYYCQR